MTSDAGWYPPEPLPFPRQQPSAQSAPEDIAPPVVPLNYQAGPARLTHAAKALRRGDRYFMFLCLALLGYALGGRGFAYWGFNPVFVGESMLVLGVFILLKNGGGLVSKLLGMRMFIPLILFMSWGACCTFPYLDTYGFDSIRDAVVWGYGTYAFIVAGLLIASPYRVQKLVLYYRKFVFWFLILAPFACIVTDFFFEYIPVFPGGGVPIIQAKGGDTCVHLGGVFAYIVALGNGLPMWLAPIMVPMNLGLNLQGRAGMVSFIVAAAGTMILRPFHHRAMRIFAVIGLGLFLLWASDLHIEKGARELSFNQLIEAVHSIVGESDQVGMDGSKEWRMKWWTDIINYTFHGKYFWTGKGFGINLANDDGYQVDAEQALRSPHNGHMTMLARAGVPGLMLWLTLQVSWAIMMVRAYLRAWRLRHNNWSGLFLFLGAYWAAFMANTSFDVFIEGPMGGIWLWCIYGAGIGCVYVYKRHPDLLTPAAAPIAVPPVVLGPVQNGMA